MFSGCLWSWLIDQFHPPLPSLPHPTHQGKRGTLEVRQTEMCVTLEGGGVARVHIFSKCCAMCQKGKKALKTVTLAVLWPERRRCLWLHPPPGSCREESESWTDTLSTSCQTQTVSSRPRSEKPMNAHTETHLCGLCTWVGGVALSLGCEGTFLWRRGFFCEPSLFFLPWG